MARSRDKEAEAANSLAEVTLRESGVPDALESFIQSKVEAAAAQERKLPVKLLDLFRREVVNGGHKPANYQYLWDLLWGKKRSRAAADSE